MEAYRDQYAELFRGGRGVTVIGISNDAPEDMVSWAKDAEFPFLFASDSAGTTAHSFGTGLRENLMIDRRTVMVVDPEGRISHVMYPFREIDPMAYEELREAVMEVAVPLEDEEMEGEG